MKTYKNLLPDALAIENIKKCIKDASAGKRTRYDVMRALKNIDEYAARIKQKLEDKDFKFTEYSTAIINRSNDKKERLIAKPRFKDQVIHHILMSTFRPIVERGLYEHVYGALPDRGPHKAKKYLEKWISKHGKKRFYVFKCDIKSFYDSVDHKILKSKLQKKIKDEDYLELLFKLIDSYPKGLPKGFYSSIWFATFYLKEFDRYIKEELKAPYYMRYVDDMVILHTNKRKLRRIKESIEEYLQNNLNLHLKENWQIYRFKDKDDDKGRDIDFMGFRFFRNKTTLRKSNLRRIRRKANHLAKKRQDYQAGEGPGITVHDAQSMLSYLGWTKHTDVYNYFQEYLKPKINVRSLRRKIANYQKMLNRKEKEKNLVLA